MPIQFLPDGGWKWTGYAGLASHGGTLGLMIALWLYCRKMKMHYMDVLDMIAVATPICACFIRLANLMNSEIIGKATDVPWGICIRTGRYASPASGTALRSNRLLHFLPADDFPV